jgi:hypothetical protein
MVRIVHVALFGYHETRVGSLTLKYRKKFGSIAQVQSFSEDNSSKPPTGPEAANSMNATDQHNGGSSDAQPKGERLSSSNEQPPAAESTNVADAGDDTSSISVMPVVGIKIPKSTPQSSNPVQQSRHIILTLSKEQKDVAEMLQSQEGQAGSFFSIHSTIQEPIRYSLGRFPKEGDPKCCLCCSYKTATFEEQWSPYQPGKGMQLGHYSSFDRYS